MWHNEPLQMWLLYAQARGHAIENAVDRRAGEMLRRIESTLDAAHNEKPDFDASLTMDRTVWQNVVPSPEEVKQAQKLYRRVWEQGGTGASYILDHLADLIALAQLPESVSFWQSLFDLKKPRDRNKQRRINTAIAALVLLAIRYRDSAAEEALLDALYHREPIVRASACFYLVAFFDLTGTQPSDEALTALRDCALSGKAYEPRYQARLALWFFEQPLPLDNPGGTYTLKVRLRRDRSPLMRRLALRSENTLFDLHMAIQKAFNWDADHLYSFYMNGKIGDDTYEIGTQEDDFLDDDFLFALESQIFDTDEQIGTGDSMPVDPQQLKEVEAALEEVLEEALSEIDADDDDIIYDVDDDDVDENQWSVFNVRLGDLGLLPKHKFGYLFDFGDNHQFEITVEALEPQADDGEYPRLLEAVGDAPRQYDYPDYEEDDEE